MSKVDVLVVEADADRAAQAMATLSFLGFHPHLAGAPLEEASDVAWRAAWLGSVTDRAGAEEQLALLNGHRVFVLHTQDSPLLHSPALKHVAASRYGQIHWPLRYEDLQPLVQRLQALVAPREEAVRLVGNSAVMQRVHQLIQQVAPFDSSVLLLGESGTGKEMVAQTIHAQSARRDKPFVAINCGAIPAELLESELFGHEKGAFTGAISTRKGRFELAEGGTLFLDEIGDMSLTMQVKLLRVIQERVFERVGGTKTQRCDVRIIAATHRNLEQSIQDGQFREDLFYRLNVFPLDTPALREHLEDLPLLIEEFNQRLVQRKAVAGPVRLSVAALRALQQYAWPGNVRELGNLIERLAILCPRGEVRVSDLPEKYRSCATAEEPTPLRALLDGGAEDDGQNRAFTGNDIPLLPEGGLDLKDHLADIEVSLIRQALDATGGVVAHAAKLLRMQRTTLVEKLRKYGLNHSLAA